MTIRVDRRAWIEQISCHRKPTNRAWTDAQKIGLRCKKCASWT